MKYLLLTILILLNFSCQNPDGNKLDSLVQSKLNERKEKYFKEKLDVCRRNLMSISQSKVDSILKMESKNQNLTVFLFPTILSDPSNLKFHFLNLINRIDQKETLCCLQANKLTNGFKTIFPFSLGQTYFYS